MKETICSRFTTTSECVVCLALDVGVVSTCRSLKVIKSCYFDALSRSIRPRVNIAMGSLSAVYVAVDDNEQI